MENNTNTSRPNNHTRTMQSQAVVQAEHMADRARTVRAEMVRMHGDDSPQARDAMRVMVGWTEVVDQVRGS